MLRILLLLFLMMPGMSLAAELAIKNIESYLNSVTTISAHFTQVDHNGEIAEGMLYLSKPGKMRWEYQSPEKILILINGNIVTHYNYELNERSSIPNNSPFKDFLLKQNLDLNKDLKLVSFRQNTDRAYLMATDPRAEDKQIITVEFEKNPIQLRKIITEDGNGEKLEITLQNFEVNHALDNKLFIFDSSIRQTNSRRR